MQVLIQWSNVLRYKLGMSLRSEFHSQSHSSSENKPSPFVSILGQPSLPFSILNEWLKSLKRDNVVKVIIFHMKNFSTRISSLNNAYDSALGHFVISDHQNLLFMENIS